MPESIYIKLPEKYKLTQSLVNEIAVLNADLSISAEKDNALIISESAFNFRNYEFIEVKFPANIFPDSNFDELYEINAKELKFEQPGNHSILLKMGLFSTIALITALISASLVVWSSKKRSGRVFSENGCAQRSST